MLTVINRNDVKEGIKTNMVWIDRRSPLGNPFPLGMKNDDKARAEVIAKYRTWLWKEMQQSNSRVMVELRHLIQLEQTHGNVSLICWCKPKPCHGDVIIKALAWLKCR